MLHRHRRPVCESIGVHVMRPSSYELRDIAVRRVQVHPHISSSRVHNLETHCHMFQSAYIRILNVLRGNDKRVRDSRLTFGDGLVAGVLLREPERGLWIHEDMSLGPLNDSHFTMPGRVCPTPEYARRRQCFRSLAWT